MILSNSGKAKLSVSSYSTFKTDHSLIWIWNYILKAVVSTVRNLQGNGIRGKNGNSLLHAMYACDTNYTLFDLYQKCDVLNAFLKQIRYQLNKCEQGHSVTAWWHAIPARPISLVTRCKIRHRDRSQTAFPTGQNLPPSEWAAPYFHLARVCSLACDAGSWS